MLSHILYFCMAIGYIFATKATDSPTPVTKSPGATDPSCTKDGKYTRQAVSCKNERGDAFCENIFGVTAEAGGENKRNVACFQSNGVASVGVKDGAIATCAKTCGYCCETPEYKCQNSEYDSCDQYSQKQCEDPVWKGLLTKLCPATCGLCLDGDCKDLAVECWKQMGVCHSIDRLTWAKENCKRTCGFCDL